MLTRKKVNFSSFIERKKILESIEMVDSTIPLKMIIKEAVNDQKVIKDYPEQIIFCNGGETKKIFLTVLTVFNSNFL